MHKQAAVSDSPAYLMTSAHAWAHFPTVDFKRLLYATVDVNLSHMKFANFANHLTSYQRKYLRIHSRDDVRNYGQLIHHHYVEDSQHEKLELGLRLVNLDHCFWVFRSRPVVVMELQITVAEKCTIV